MEFIFEFILEGISEVTFNLKIHPLLKIAIGIITIFGFSILFIWIMVKLGVWQ